MKKVVCYLAFIQNSSSYFAALVWRTIDRISFLLIKKGCWAVSSFTCSESFSFPTHAIMHWDESLYEGKFLSWSLLHFLGILETFLQNIPGKNLAISLVINFSGSRFLFLAINRIFLEESKKRIRKNPENAV